MENKLTFAVIGGDRRNFFAAKRLREKGFKTEIWGLKGEKNFCPGKEICANAAVLPLPLTRDGKHLFAPESEYPILLEDVFRSISHETWIFGGNMKDFSNERRIDYAKRESFALFNAVPTAEGALLLALQNGNRTIFGTRIGIIGYGKVAFSTAKLFHAAGADVTVFARKAQARIEAHMMGYTAKSISELSECIGEYELLINTVPARILQRDILSKVSKNAFLMDLASAPFGLDFEEAASLGIHAECASGLPGRFFPETAGYAVADTVLDILREKKILF